MYFITTTKLFYLENLKKLFDILVFFMMEMVPLNQLLKLFLTKLKIFSLLSNIKNLLHHKLPLYLISYSNLHSNIFFKLCIFTKIFKPNSLVSLPFKQKNYSH